MHICVTRFNNVTFHENFNWKKKNNELGCIYGTPIKISENILPNSQIIVLEMNNTTNKIEGIGIIKNKIEYINKKKYKIYEDNNYNRFIYKSNLRIDKLDFNNYEKKVIKVLENLLFKNSNHFKRGHGIQKLPNFISENKIFNFNKFLINLYEKKFVDIKSKNYKLLISNSY